MAGEKRMDARYLAPDVASQAIQTVLVETRCTVEDFVIVAACGSTRFAERLEVEWSRMGDAVEVTVQ